MVKVSATPFWNSSGDRTMDTYHSIWSSNYNRITYCSKFNIHVRYRLHDSRLSLFPRRSTLSSAIQRTWAEYYLEWLVCFSGSLSIPFLEASCSILFLDCKSGKKRKNLLNDLVKDLSSTRRRFQLSSSDQPRLGLTSDSYEWARIL